MLFGRSQFPGRRPSDTRWNFLHLGGNPETAICTSRPSLVFGLQQISEGIVWTGIHHHDADLVRTSSLFYLFFALAFWPFWIPFCVTFMEDRPKVKYFLTAITVFGLAFGAVLFGPLVVSGGAGLRADVIHHSLFYNLRDLPPFNRAARFLWQGVYIALMFCPFVIGSPDRRFTLFGILLAAATVISHFVFWYAFVSVWCFFAAFLSLQLCYIFYRLEQPQLHLS